MRDRISQCDWNSGEPAKSGISIADIAAGIFTYSGVLASLIQRGVSGEGDILEISRLEALGEWMSQPYFYAEYGDVQQVRSGAEHATVAPDGPFRVIDGTVFFGVQNEREWSRFCEIVLGSTDVSSILLFAGNSARVANGQALHNDIDQAFVRQSTGEALSRLDAAGIANAELRDMDEFSAHPQLEARDRWRDVDSPVGPLRTLIPPVTSRAAGFRMDRVPALGEHTAAVLAELAQ